MLRMLMALALALGANQAAAQGQGAAQGQAPQAPPRTYTADQLWTRTGERITFMPARISFERRAGTLSLEETNEVSHSGEGLDNAMLFRSSDRQILATVYIYYPPLAHAGLSAFATGQALVLLSEGSLQPLATRLVAAGGGADAALRIDYRGYRRTLASSAAFIKADRWIVKLRVSGPEDRRAEVEAAMTALLADMRFEGDVHPRPAAHAPR